MSNFINPKHKKSNKTPAEVPERKRRIFISSKNVLVSILVPSITPLNLATLMTSDSNSPSMVNTPTPMTTAQVSEEEKAEIRHTLVQQRADDYRTRLAAELETKANEEYQKQYEALTAAQLKKKYDPLIQREKRIQLEKFRHSAFKRVRDLITKELDEWDKEYDRRRREIEEKCKRNMFNADKGKKISLSHLAEYREKQKEVEREELLRKLDEEKANKEKQLLAKATEEERKENEKKIREETAKRLKRIEDAQRKVEEEDNQFEEMKRQEFEERKKRLSIYTGRKDMIKNLAALTPTPKNEENNNKENSGNNNTQATDTTTNGAANGEENTEKADENTTPAKIEDYNNNNQITSISPSSVVNNNAITTPYSNTSLSTVLFSPIPTQSPTLPLSNLSSSSSSNFNTFNNNNNSIISASNNNNYNISSISSSNSSRNLPPLSGGGYSSAGVNSVIPTKTHHNSYPMSECDLILPSSPISNFKSSQSLPSLSGRSTPTEVLVQTRYLNYSCCGNYNNNRRYNGMRRRVKMKILTPIQQTPVYPTLDQMNDIHSNIPSYLTPNVTVSPIK